MAKSAKKRRRELMVASAQAFGETRRIERLGDTERMLVVWRSDFQSLCVR